jgi:hypothetical protein
MDVYLYAADLFCEDCGDKIKASLAAQADPDNESTWDSDEYPKGPYAEGGGEADSPQHCDDCGVFLENPLTNDGARYVVEQCEAYISGDDAGLGGEYVSCMVSDRAEMDGAKILAQWARFYPEAFDDV